MNIENPEKAASPDGDEVVIPVIEEQVVAGARPVKTGAVRVDKHVEKCIRKVEIPLLHQEVEVKRIAINRVVSEAPAIRRNGATVIVPVVEEELVITKRLVLKEEIHLIKRSTRDRFVRDVELDRERAEVHRLDAEGRIVDAQREKGPIPRATRRRSILE